MKVFTYPKDWYPDDLNSRLDFNEFENSETNEALFIGLAATYDKEIINTLGSYNRTVYLNLEHPCTLYSGKNSIGLNPIQQQILFSEVYTICPYTAEWLNAKENIKTKFLATPYMHNLKYDLYHSVNKKFDVAYAGLIHHEEISSYIEAIKSFKYVFTSINSYNRIHNVDHMITHNNIPNIQKWNILAKTKIAVIQNNLYLKPEQIRNIQNTEDWSKNFAFSDLSSSCIPQLKSRTVESALCKNLMLVKKDKWNVIEYWFEPNKDFIYFENATHLKALVAHLLKQYESQEIQQIIKNAYNKVVKYYNTKHIFDRIKQGKGVLDEI